MTDKQQGVENQGVEAAGSAALPRVEPRVIPVGNNIAVEFRIEDLIRRIIPSAAGHCGGCYGCSGCSH